MAAFQFPAMVAFSTAAYLSLLQHQGARHFKSAMTTSMRPRGSVTEVQSYGRHKTGKKLITITLDILQSWGAPLVMIVLWSCLQAGVYTRGWFVFSCFTAHWMCGLRSFVAILRQRLATLRNVARIVHNTTAGSREAKQRRAGFVTGKTLTLVIDLSSIFCVSVLTPASIMALGSTFNSRQFAIHIVVMLTPVVIAGFFTNIHIQHKLRRAAGQRHPPATATVDGHATNSVLSQGKSIANTSSVVDSTM
jgi:hypothetical protein